MPTPTVYLVGAGPGDPGLLTLRGKECIAAADFVLYDQLVSPRVLEHARPEAELICVTELGPTHPERCPHIAERLIAEARQGKCVVRLKGGDPLVFGRGGEEAEALRQAGIPYEIVPGVTAALAAAAYLEVPLTHREHASAVAFVTGHEDADKPKSRIDWQALAAFPGTLVIYMGIARLGAIVAELVRHGKDPNTPAAAVQRASTGEQRSVMATLATLDEAVRRTGLSAPAVVLIGPVVGLKPRLSWFESRPLLGRRVLVTRPRHQAAPLVERLERLGAVPVLLPVVEVRDPADWSRVDAALNEVRAGRFDWLVFTSANGVQAFFRRLRQRGWDMRSVGSIQIAAIGSATALALREFQLEPDLVPGEGMNSEKLAEELMERVRGRRVLLAQADRGRELLHERLAAVATVEQVAVYFQADAVDRASPAFEQLRRGEIDIITLTSPNIARAFLKACDEVILKRLQRGEISVVTNSARSSAVLHERGLPVAKESGEPTIDGLVAALVAL
jgi:uroporphyrinogen III methyltransferase / synthase